MNHFTKNAFILSFFWFNIRMSQDNLLPDMIFERNKITKT